MMSGLSGVPGVRSTKKLPSRNRRGRIFAVASVCSGSALLSIVIVTTAASRSPPTCLTVVTCPTFTPAMRTEARGWISLAERKTALMVKLCWNGSAPPKAMYTPMAIRPGINPSTKVRSASLAPAK